MALLGNLFNRSAGVPTSGTPARPKLKPVPRHRISDSVDLVDVMSIIGPALVLDNGTFVRILEVQPVDLQRGDKEAKLRHWTAFAQALRRVHAPSTWQLLISSRPQAIRDYIQVWRDRAGYWRQLADRTDDKVLADRRDSRATDAEETSAWLDRLNDALCPMQQRYLLVIPHNPFAIALTKKRAVQQLDDRAIQSALHVLEGQVRHAKAILGDTGVKCVELDGPAMCQALWESYHHSPSLLGSGLSSRYVLEQTGRDHAFSIKKANYHPPSRDQFLRAAADPVRLATLLAPDRLEEDPSYLQVGEVFGRCYIIHDFSSQAPVDLASLLAFPADITHSLYFVAADPIRAKAKLRDKSTELQSIKLRNQLKGVVTDWKNDAAIAAIEELRQEAEAELQTPFDLYWYVIVWANNINTLGDVCRDFEVELTRCEYRFTPATRHQSEIFMACRPVARRGYQHAPRLMSADSLGSFFPWVRREYMEKGGYHFGVHKGSGMIVSLDPFKNGNNNASALLIGSQRSGKSLTIKSAILDKVTLGHRAFVLDPEEEYKKLAIHLHAPYIEVAMDHEPRRVHIGAPADGGPAHGLREMEQQYEAYTDTALTPDLLNQLAWAYDLALERCGIDLEAVETWEREAPLLQDVLTPLAESPHRRVREIARVLAYADPARYTGFFNPLDLHRRSDHPIRHSAESLVSFTESIARRALTAIEFNVLVKAYRETLRLAGVREDVPETWQRENMPVLSNLVDRLHSMKESDEALNLGSILEQFAYDGLYAGMFNQRTTIDLGREQVAFFGMKSLRQSTDDKLAAIVTRVQLNGVQNEIFINSGSRQPTHVVVDEARFVFAYAGAGARFVSMSQSFPKYMAALYLVFHTAESFLSNPESAMIKDMTRFKMIYRQESTYATNALAAIFELTPAEQEIIRRSGQGECLLIADNDLRIPIYNAVNLDREGILRSDIEMQYKLSVAAGRKVNPIV